MPGAVLKITKVNRGNKVLAHLNGSRIQDPQLEGKAWACSTGQARLGG